MDTPGQLLVTPGYIVHPHTSLLEEQSPSHTCVVVNPNEDCHIPAYSCRVLAPTAFGLLVVGIFIGLMIACFNSRRKSQSLHEWIMRRQQNRETPDGIIAFDNQGTITEINRVACDILGVNGLDYVGRHVDKLLCSHDPLYNTKNETPISRLLQGEVKHIAETGILLTRPDGCIIHINYELTAIHDEEGRLVEGMIHFQDMSRLNISCDELDMCLANDRLLNMILNIIPCHVFIKDANDDFRYKMVNRCYLDYYQFNHAEVIGHTDRDIFSPEVATMLRENDLTVCQHPGRVHIFDESVSYKKSGQEIFQILKVCFEGNATSKFLLGICVDVTALAQQLNQARHSEKSKGLFLATMSHEIRTPLNVILGLIELMRTGKFPEAKRDEAMRAMGESANALLAIINDVLDFSKLEAGQMMLQDTPTDLSKLFNETCNLFRLTSSQKKLQFHADFANDLPMATLDCSRLRQIIINLLSNAVKYTQQGSITFRAVLSAPENGKSILTLDVEDTGAGIPTEVLPHIFEQYKTVSRVPGSNAEHNSTGLGLAICKQLTELMHGSIHVKSQVAVGTCFTVTIPDIPCTARTATDTTAVSTETTPKLPLESKILLVDDMPMNLRILQTMLANLGFKHLYIASNGKVALAMMNHEQYDYLLTDLWMPAMNGAQLVKKVKESGLQPNLICAALSADTISHQNFDMKYFQAEINKPITLDKLRTFFQEHPPRRK